MGGGGISNAKSYSIRACFEKGVFYNGQFTAICWTAYFRWKTKNVKKKTVSVRLLWESIKCYTDDFKNNKMFFLILLDSINFLPKNLKFWTKIFEIFFGGSLNWIQKYKKKYFFIFKFICVTFYWFSKYSHRNYFFFCIVFWNKLYKKCSTTVCFEKHAIIDKQCLGLPPS